MNNYSLQNELAEYFRKLHNNDDILIIPNAWDVASAKIFELSGFQAIGTTSAGISSTLGFPDEERIGIEATVNVVSSIHQNTNLPITADIEAGYSENVDEIARNIAKIIFAGAVGINLEDCMHNGSKKLFDLAVQCEKISAVREQSNLMGVRIFINARTDSILLSDDSIAKKIAMTIDRANRYIESGADGIFVPDEGELNRDVITTLIKNINAPLNIIAGTSILPISMLKDIGVRRISLGPRAMRATFFLLQKISEEILSEGTFKLLESGPFTYSYVNSWFENKDSNK